MCFSEHYNYVFFSVNFFVILFLLSVLLSNDPGKVESNFFCYAAMCFPAHRNVLIFTQRMHKPTERPFPR